MQNEAAPTDAPKKLTKTEKARAAEVCLKHASLVRSIAKQYVRPGCDLEDLIQIGYFGLMKAISDWREGGGSSFVTIANLRIRDALRSAVARDSVTDEVSMDDDFGGDSESDAGNNLHDFIGEDGDQEETVEANEIRDNVQRALASLSKDDRDLVKLYEDCYATGTEIREGGKTAHSAGAEREAARRLGIPRSTLQDRFKKTKARLADALIPTYAPPATLAKAS